MSLELFQKKLNPKTEKKQRQHKLKIQVKTKEKEGLEGKVEETAQNTEPRYGKYERKEKEGNNRGVNLKDPASD